MIDLYEQRDLATERRRVAERAIGVVAALLLVIGVVAAAIGKDAATSTDAVGLLGAAPDAAREAGTARLTLTTTTGEGGFSTTGEGLVDFRNGNSEMTIGMGAFEFSMKTIDGAIYMKIPGVVTLPTPWVKIALPSGTSTNGFAPGAGSVTGYIDSLRGVGEVTDEGRETVNGVPTTKYHVVIDVSRAMASIPESNRAELEQTFGTVPDVPDIPMDVWLSDGGLPVRTETTVEMAGFTSTTRLDLTDFGVEIDIQPPPDDQVTEVSDMAELSKLFTDAVGAAE